MVMQIKLVVDRPYPSSPLSECLDPPLQYGYLQLIFKQGYV